jgi:hypothetical protein
MKKKLICILVLCISAGLFAAEPFDSVKLSAFLPKGEVKKFTRMELGPMAPVDRLTSAMVNYLKMPSNFEGKPDIISVGVSIMDGIMYPDSIEKQIAPNSKDDELITIKGKYKGVRANSTSASGDKLLMVRWIVNGRFVVQVFISGSNDLVLAEKFIDLVDMDGLLSASKKK